MGNDAARSRSLAGVQESAQRMWTAAWIASGVVLLLPFVLRLDGKPHADWEQFLGRFHVLAIHIPIGLIVLAPVLELAARYRPVLREAAGFVLALAFAACVGTVMLGFLLAHGSGETGVTITRHMWGGVGLTLSVLACLVLRPFWLSLVLPRLYPAALVLSLLVLVWTAHEGGSMTHGDSYLTQYMPAPMKRLVAFTGTGGASSNSFYALHVDPIFQSNCVSCHGASKTHGGLRLDSYAQLMSGGKDGAVIAAGQPEKSMLLERVTLPSSDKRFMPAEGHPPLLPREIDWIRAWIQQGASSSATSLAGVSVPEPAKEPPLQPVGDYSSLMPEIRAMQQAQGAKLLPVSSTPSDGLVLFTTDNSPTFNDAQLAQFEKFAPYIVEAELGRTAITDASFDTLAKFTHLRALHLEDTAVTGAAIARLAPLTQLTYLNLSDTQVTPAAASSLTAMKNLRHVYLFNTPAQPAPAAEAAIPAPATGAK